MSLRRRDKAEAEAEFSRRHSDGSTRGCPLARAAEGEHWVEIELLDEEGEPVAGESYRLELPNGSVREGSTNLEGRARVEGIPGGQCEVSFPNLGDETWERG